jgi:hypothetical protein
VLTVVVEKTQPRGSHMNGMIGSDAVCQDAKIHPRKIQPVQVVPNLTVFPMQLILFPQTSDTKQITKFI